jgi:hypothetical protein
MMAQFTEVETARFLRTLRVTTQTALAQYALERGRAGNRPSVTFLALAAKGPDAWRFPASGLTSADGLVVATLTREASGAAILELQAQGVVGLSLYANRSARVAFAADQSADGAFDRDGRMRLALGEMAINEADLATFALELLDDSP